MFRARWQIDRLVEQRWQDGECRPDQEDRRLVSQVNCPSKPSNWISNSTRDRANLRLADVENSGRADIIWLNKYTGAAQVFKNNGYAGPNGGGYGSSFSWSVRGVLYAAIDRGEVMVRSLELSPIR
jgi:hypothetical protein